MKTRKRCWSLFTKSRKGFTLLEMLASTIFMAFIVLAAMQLTLALETQRTVASDTIYLSIHNLNCMERLRQMAQQLSLDSTGTLQSYYSDSIFGTIEVKTEVYIDEANLGEYHVYNVRIESRMRDFPQKLYSEYILTDIGAPVYVEEYNPEIDSLDEDY